MKISKLFFPFFCIGTCFAIMFLFIMNISPKIALSGVTEKNEKPEIQLKTIMSGEYQTQYQAWFGDEFPLRGVLIKGYDQMLYSAGGQVNYITRGKSGYLHGKEDLTAYIAGYVDESALEKYGNNLKIISDKMKEMNKPFFYIISPGKAEVYSETLPWNYRLAEKSTKNKAALRLGLVKMLEDNDIPYIDMTELMLQIRQSGREAFTRTGFHWNQYAQSLAILEMLDLLRNEFQMDVPELVFSYSETTTLFDEDDYRKILNVYFPGPKDIYYAAYPHYVENEMKPEDKKSVFAMSTSFSQGEMNLFSRSEMPFKSIWRMQYSQFQDRLYSEAGKTNWQSWIPGVPVSDINLDEILADTDVMYFESHVDNIPQPHLDLAQRLADYLTN